MFFSYFCNNFNKVPALPNQVAVLSWDAYLVLVYSLLKYAKNGCCRMKNRYYLIDC